MKMFWVGILVTTAAWGQPDLPTELEDCTGPSAEFCFDGAPALIDSGCGALFENYQGRIAWPPLRNVGPVTISVQARHTFTSQTFFPLYVEVQARRIDDPPICQDGLGGLVVLVARGADRCGGTWESIGPIDLVPFGVPLGSPYSVQCIFFRTTPSDVTVRTVGFSCIRVTSHPSILVSTSWGNVRTLFK